MVTPETVQSFTFILRLENALKNNFNIYFCIIIENLKNLNVPYLVMWRITLKTFLHVLMSHSITVLSINTFSALHKQKLKQTGPKNYTFM